MLELINRARMNPAAEAARQGISLNQGLAPGTIIDGAQAGAGDERLSGASPPTTTANGCCVNDLFNHQESASLLSGRTGLNPGDRMTAAGYVFAGPTFAYGENISWTGIYRRDQSHHRHRRAAPVACSCRPATAPISWTTTFREVGIGQELGVFTQRRHQL